MPTLDDLRSVLRDLESQAGDPDAVLNRLTRQVDDNPRSRRHLVATLVAAASVVALVVGVAVISASAGGSGDEPTAGPLASGLPVTSYSFTIGALPDGFTSQYTWSSSSYQSAEIQTAAGVGCATVTVYAATGNYPKRPATAADVQINGQAGWTDVLPVDLPTGKDTQNTPAPSSIVWRDSTGVVVSVTPYTLSAAQGGLAAPPLTAAQVLQIAQAVQVGAQQPVRFPAKFAYLPPGMGINDIDEGLPNGGHRNADLSIGTSSNGLNISIGTGDEQLGRVGTAPEQKVTIGAFSGLYGEDEPAILLSNGHTNVIISYNAGQKTSATDTHTRAIPLDELTKIVTGLTIAPNPDDTSTWFTAGDAIPQ